MTEITGNIWDFKTPTTPIVITTNGTIKKDGRAVMGRGIALQAAERYGNLPLELGVRLKDFGNRVFYFPEYNIITFPVKHNWYEKADLSLIAKSAEQLHDLCYSDYINIAENYGWEKVYLVRPGCSNGKLEWEDVRPVIAGWLSNENFVVVQN